MAREGVEQLEVAVSVVGDLPVEVAHQDWFEQAAGLYVLVLVGQLTRRGVRRPRWQAFTDLVVDLLQVGKEPVPALRKDVRGAPERHVTSRPQQLPRAPVANRWIEPVPGGGREHQIETLVFRGVDVLERALDDLDAGEAGQVATRHGGQRRPRLDASDVKTPAGQRQRRLAAGGAPDLQQPVIRIELSGSDHRLVQRLGVLRPACW